MTQQGFTVVYERVSLLFIQVLQFVYVILTLRLSFPHIYIRQNSLDYDNLDYKRKTHQMYDSESKKALMLGL